MKEKSAAMKEKEREQKLKALRRDLEQKLEEQLPAEMFDEKTRVEIEKVDVNEKLPPEKAKQVVESLLFASSKPMSVKEIRKVMRAFSNKEIEDFIAALKEDYNSQGRSFEILEIAGGWEIVTKKEYAPWICRAEMQKKTRQATQSALETLAILAYKQPLTRAEIEELRGVDASGVVANLMDRGFIKIVGKKEIPGRPFLYATTEKFLEHFGLNSLKDLPNIEEIQRMVEQSIKKEELLGREKLVEAATLEAPAGTGEAAPAEGGETAPQEEGTDAGETGADESGEETPASDSGEEAGSSDQDETGPAYAAHGEEDESEEKS